MSDSTNIYFSSDEDENLDPDSGAEDTSFDVEEFESLGTPDPTVIVPDDFFEEPATPQTPLPKSITDKDEEALQKLIQDEVKKAEREAKRVLNEKKKEIRKANKRMFQDEAKTLARRKALDMKAATQRRKEIRSSAVSKRVATYSLAASLGSKGYVIASIADQFFYQPEEDSRIAAEEQYQRDYANALADAEDDLLRRRREAEDELDAMKPDSIDPEAIAAKVRSGPLGGPGGGPGTGNTGGGGPPAPSGPGSPSGPPNQPPAPLNPPGPPPPPPGPPNPPGPPGLPPPNFPPPPGPPMPPGNNWFTPNMAAMLTLGVEIANVLDDAIRTGVQRHNQMIQSTFSGSTIEGITATTKSGLGPVLDLPLIGSIFEGAIDTFGTYVDQFGSYAKKDVGFSPLTLAESVDISIKKLQQSIEIARELDPSKAALTQAMGELDLVWNEFKAEFFSVVAPTIIDILKDIKMLLQALKPFQRTMLQSVLDMTTSSNYAVRVAYYIYSLARDWINSQKANKNNMNVFKQIEQFHDPSFDPMGPMDFQRFRRK